MCFVGQQKMEELNILGALIYCCAFELPKKLSSNKKVLLLKVVLFAPLLYSRVAPLFPKLFSCSFANFPDENFSSSEAPSESFFFKLYFHSKPTDKTPKLSSKGIYKPCGHQGTLQNIYEGLVNKRPNMYGGNSL